MYEKKERMQLICPKLTHLIYGTSSTYDLRPATRSRDPTFRSRQAKQRRPLLVSGASRMTILWRFRVSARPQIGGLTSTQYTVFSESLTMSVAILPPHCQINWRFTAPLSNQLRTAEPAYHVMSMSGHLEVWRF